MLAGEGAPPTERNSSLLARNNRSFFNRNCPPPARLRAYALTSPTVSPLRGSAAPPSSAPPSSVGSPSFFSRQPLLLQSGLTLKGGVNPQFTLDNRQGRLTRFHQRDHRLSGFGRPHRKIAQEPHAQFNSRGSIGESGALPLLWRWSGGRRRFAGDRRLGKHSVIPSRHLSGSARRRVLFFRHGLLLGFHCS